MVISPALGVSTSLFNNKKRFQSNTKFLAQTTVLCLWFNFKSTLIVESLQSFKDQREY